MKNHLFTVLAIVFILNGLAYAQDTSPPVFTSPPTVLYVTDTTAMIF
jgi:hypothetical protein